MRELPIAIVVAALIYNGKILLIRRRRGDYVGLWGLPGGKIEKDEHISGAAEREIREESGIEAHFKKYLGVVSEHLVEEGRIVRHFLLHVCELIPDTTAILHDHEGRLDWFPLADIAKLKETIIPSDFAMIDRMVSGMEKGYFRCVMEKSGERHLLKYFVRDGD